MIRMRQTALKSNIPSPLGRAHNCWGFQRGLNIPLVASGVHTPIAKYPVDLLSATKLSAAKF